MFKRNVVELVGNLVDNPDFKDMGDFKVANFFLAVDRTVDLNDGSSADFIPIVCKNDLAVSADTYLRKGRRIFVDGRIQVRTYDDDHGNRRWVTEIVAKSIQYLDAPPEDVASGNQGSRNNNYSRSGNQGNGGGQRNNGNRGNYGNAGSNRNNQGQGGGGNRNYGNRGGQSGGNGGNGNRGGNGGGNNNQRYGNNGSGNYGNQGGSREYSGAGAGGGGGRSNSSMPWEQ
ncbi:single-stranded DNA-binding protein [Paenibacillus allorhizosphaerae]|uniref:Single-stranded DNA-binding protein n=1 Tax=Paenibacillus allorhizosphaerae TaxID=2849866 RepID=A0ABN7TV56_9BACL|nr:single-stranded DNA-binding protein [Paenibacillus allorhizosphaerae]CAG7651569.1 Single-stranded DNA-binding protein [Paenibacillus allorhizosphaerae]